MTDTQGQQAESAQAQTGQEQANPQNGGGTGTSSQADPQRIKQERDMYKQQIEQLRQQMMQMQSQNSQVPANGAAQGQSGGFQQGAGAQPTQSEFDNYIDNLVEQGKLDEQNAQIFKGMFSRHKQDLERQYVQPIQQQEAQRRQQQVQNYLSSIREQAISDKGISLDRNVYAFKSIWDETLKALNQKYQGQPVQQLQQAGQLPGYFIQELREQAFRKFDQNVDVPEAQPSTSAGTATQSDSGDQNEQPDDMSLKAQMERHREENPDGAPMGEKVHKMDWED